MHGSQKEPGVQHNFFFGLDAIDLLAIP